MTATQAPTPGPLSGDDVKLLVKGDLLRVVSDEVMPIGSVVTFAELDFDDTELRFAEGDGLSWMIDRFAFIGRPDADGWMPWSGGENPVPGKWCEWFFEHTGPYAGLSSDTLWDRVTRFRLAPTAPVEASGQDDHDLKLIIAHTIIEDLRVQHPGIEQMDNERGDIWLPGGSTPQSSGCIIDIHSVAQSVEQQVLAALRPGHTDLMVSPEGIDAFLESNPPPVEASGSEREHGPKCWGKTSLSDEMAHCYCGSTDSPSGEMREVLGGQQGDSETLRVLLDNLVIAQTLSKDIRQKATDEARSYLYDLRHTPQPSGETRELLERSTAIADDVERGKRPKLEAVDMIRELRSALLSVRPLALGGQHSGGVTADSLTQSVTDETMRALLSCKDVGTGRAHLAAIINSLSTTPARAEAQDEGAAGERADTAFKIASDLHAAYEQLIYGLPKYLEAENLTDEENMIREAYVTLDVTAHRLAALSTTPARAEAHPLGRLVPEEITDEDRAWAASEIEKIKDMPSPWEDRPNLARAEALDEGAATDDLVDRFAVALKAKLRAAGEKYGFDDAWKADDWRDKLIEDLLRHIQKGDPRDVAAYCAFAWHHDWSLSPKQDDLRSAAFTDRGAEDRYVSQDEGAAGERDKLVAALADALAFIDDMGTDLHHARVADWYPEGANNAAVQMSEDMRLAGNRCATYEPLVDLNEIGSAHPSPTPAADADRVRIAVEAFNAKINAPLTGPTHGAWDRGRIAGLKEALAALKSEGK